MFRFFKMKRQEWQLKSMFYGVALKLIDERKEILDMLPKLYDALKDTPADEFQSKIISALAQIVHEENKKTKGE